MRRPGSVTLAMTDVVGRGGVGAPQGPIEDEPAEEITGQEALVTDPATVPMSV
jgi:hypothetical protein